MNSYPPELLSQLPPLMFAAGLDVPEVAPRTPIKDPFLLLIYRLRDALVAQRKVAIWQPDKSKTFQTILVDKNVTFPPRKISPTGAPSSSDDSQAHSPLSPLTPSSPLYPDGIIAPLWVRKHTTLVPSVFVLFLQLYESPQLVSQSPLDGVDPDREREREQEERRKDAELAGDIAQRKKTTNERGIKLTVVLIASRKMLDDPSLDGRLTFIRRQSGLDNRAALFVLSPVSAAELGDFVRSLQQALYDPAVEYYTAHSKRVRRKRNRHAQATHAHPVTPIGLAAPTAVPRPLRPEGWTVRYEYKMACFAEFRGEEEVALKHYQDAYSTVIIMFGSTAILPPRTKRWAEAKVLADCINIKICKLYLYNNEHALALSQHTSHIRKFSDLSRGWGIGEETFEFWSWIARQHRALAELLEQGTSHSSLVIPSHQPSGSASTASDTVSALGLNPAHALQHPGFYYYMASRCTEARRERFEAALATEAALSNAPGFANEKKVDHLTVILELYTKAYELFKKHAPSQAQTQGRLTLWIAYRISQTYYESGKFDMAVRFFERIAKTYRREKWGSMLRPLLATWYSCAKRMGDVELSVKLLVEMLGYGDSEGLGVIEEDLMAILKSTVPSRTKESLVVDLSESEPILDPTVLFWTPEVKIGEQTAFQLCLAALTTVSITRLPISSLTINFSGNLPPITVKHTADPEHHPIRRVNLGHISPSEDTHAYEVEGDLRWEPGERVILAGTLSSDVPTTVKISNLVLTVTEGNWTIEIPFSPYSADQASSSQGKWLVSVDPVRFMSITSHGPPHVTVRHRPHLLSVSLLHQPPAYLDEEYPISIQITNDDSRDLEFSVDVLLQPPEIDHAESYMILEDQKLTGLIKGISFGVISPGMSASKVLRLVSTGGAGDRILDVSIQSRSPISLPSHQRQPSTSNDAQHHDVTDTLRTLNVPVTTPFKVNSSIKYRRTLALSSGIGDIRSFDSDVWDDQDGGEASVTAVIGCCGPWSLEVESVKLLREESDHCKILACFSDLDTENFKAEYVTGDEFSDTCIMSLAPPDDYELERTVLPAPGKYEITWKRISSNGERGSRSTSVLSLPGLQPPIDGLVTILTLPAMAKLHVPVTLEATIRNRHPSRSANVTVQLQLDAADGFVVAGLRSGRVPLLLPKSEQKLKWSLIPIECGYVKLPRIRVTDRRKVISGALSAAGTMADVESEDVEVEVVDFRWDYRTAAELVDAGGVSSDKAESTIKSSTEQLHTILVIP